MNRTVKGWECRGWSKATDAAHTRLGGEGNHNYCRAGEWLPGMGGAGGATLPDGATISNTEGSHVGRAWCFTKEGPLWDYCDTDGDLYVRLGDSDSDFDSAENCSGERRRSE